MDSKRNIHKVITSELVVRTNNVRYRQEYGEVGSALNIREDGNNTIFTTVFGIDKVVFVTVNGVTLIEGLHYEITSEFTILISKNGDAPIKKNPDMTTNILVGYNYTSKLSSLINVPTDPPTVDIFYLSESAGKAAVLSFNFKITPFDGQNIFWSILKDGSETPLYSGTALETINGTVPDGLGGVTDLLHEITQQEYEDRQGEVIPFTFVVVYDLTNDGTSLDEKILVTAHYLLVEDILITGDVDSVPESLLSAGSNEVTVNYDIYKNGSVELFAWKLLKIVVGEADIQMASGNQDDTLSDSVIDTVALSNGDNYVITYSLQIKTVSSTVFTQLASDTTVINVPTDEQLGNAGYLDTAVFNYEVTPGNWIKIGDLGTPQDAVEYNNRVSRVSFTKNIDKAYLFIDQKYVAAPVYTDGGNISEVHFMLEVPDSWGAIQFNQALGATPITDFNAISLGNGYTAYIYKKGSSSVVNPTDFYIKPEPVI